VILTDNEARLAVAFLLQPVVSFVAGFAVFPIVDYSNRVIGLGRASSVLDGGIAFGFGTAIVGGLVTVLVAWPVVVWLMRRGPVTRRTVLLGGLLLGNVPAVLAIIASSVAILNADASESARINLSYVSVIVARAVPLGSAIGLAGAAVFWLVAREPVQHHLPSPDDSSWPRSPH
jgi:hypothetical protein